jgi:hypothetical protein
MFGHMTATPILSDTRRCSVEETVKALSEATEGAIPMRWIEFPTSVLVFAAVAGNPESGAFYVLDRRTGTWLWVDFEDEQYAGYEVRDFDLLVHEYDFLSLVERPALLSAAPGWRLEPGKPAEMAGPSK